MKKLSSEGSFERELKGGDKKEYKPKKHKRSNENKGGVMAYKTYAEAVRNRRSDEITIYDPVNRVYRNVKIYPRRRRRTFFTW